MADDVDVHVGQRIRIARKAKGISQSKLGRAIDVTFQQVQKYEKGVNRVGGSRLLNISKALDVPVAYFFDGLGVAPLEPDGVTWWNLKWAKQLDNITDQKLYEHIIGLIESCAAKK